MVPTSTSLNIALSEPLVVLPALDSPEFDDATQRLGAYAVRGVLVLHLSKPTKIARVDMDLSCKATTAWPRGTMFEGVPLTGMEQHTLHMAQESLFDAEMDSPRGRNLSRCPEGTPSHARGIIESEPVASGSRSSFPLPTTPIERLSHFLGFSEKEGVVFAPGTYRFPICLEVPLDLPPTAHPRIHPASVVWNLGAHVTRIGKKELFCVQEVIVVRAAPVDQEMVATVERTWLDQLHYRISVDRNLEYSLLSFELILRPLEKVKIHRITVALEGQSPSSFLCSAQTYVIHLECASFYTKDHQLVLNATPKITELLTISRPHSHTDHVLPFPADDIHGFEQSALFSLLAPGEDAATSSFMSMQPWTIKKRIMFGGHGFSATHLSNHSNIKIWHSIKVTIRVKRSDLEGLFDCTVNIPFDVVSRRLFAGTNRLPEYTRDEPTPESTRARWAGFGETEAEQMRCRMRFERLISGQEDVMGDVPPAYEPQNAEP